METAKRSLKGVIIGIWLIAGLVILGGVFFVKNPLSYALGEIVGSLTATIMMLHLYRSLDYELDLPEKKAVAHSRAMAILRNIIAISVFVLSVLFPNWLMPITVFTGMLGMKAAALLVPVYSEWKKKRGNNVSHE